jgi:outer membrane protein assembly factor BamB
LSDFFGKKPTSSGKQPPETNPWQQDPFTAYNDNESIEWPPVKPGFGSRTAFTRQDAQAGQPDAAKPDFSAAPSRVDPTNESFIARPSSAVSPRSFEAVGSDAPTRVTPVVPPTAALKDTKGVPVVEEPASPATPGRQRRAGRVSPPVTAEANPIAAVPEPLPLAEQPMPLFDPFEAGDSEAVAPPRDPSPRAPGGISHPARVAEPGQRYTGARTALPRNGSVPDGRRQANVTREEGTSGIGDNSNPLVRERLSGFVREGEPWQRPQTNMDMDAFARQTQPLNSQEPRAGATPAQRREPPRRPPVPPARSRDEEDDIEPEEEQTRRGGVLVPVLVVLLVIGGLLAGILVPDWAGMGGGLGAAMAEIKSTVVSALESVKDLVSPTDTRIESFSISPTTATAPVELVFTVQTSSAVKDLRIIDQEGTVILRKTLTDTDTLDGEVTKNSNGNIWTLRYTFVQAYDGLFTAQAMQKDGTWGEDLVLEQPVSIAAPVAAAIPVQDFTADLQEGEVPATIGFTVVTSLDVTAVQIQNDYGDIVAEAYLNDSGNQVTESEQTRTWSLSVAVTDSYKGSLIAAYETDADLVFIPSDYSVTVDLYAAGAKPTQDTAGTDGDAQSTAKETATVQPTATPMPTATPTPTAAPTVTPSPSPTPEPTPVTTPEPTKLPILTSTVDDAALPSVLKLTAKAYEGTKKQDIYSRDEKIVMDNPFQYAVWDQSGVLTFRGGPFRQNAASGTVEIASATMTELWKVAMEGSTSAKSGKLTGVSWPGQPLIVKWPTQLRTIQAIKDAFKEKTALKEVIVASQNGKLYFVDLVTGELTRDPVELGYPSNGVLSLQTNVSPMLAIGQHTSVLANKKIDNGLHLFNLLTDKEIALLDGRDKLTQTNYSGFNGAPLFDMETGVMVVGGENGLLYTMDPNDDFDYILGTLKITPSYQRYLWLANKQKAKNTNVDGSVAMYGAYVYFADQTGILQCVDVNTLTPLWAADTGDNTDATIALDMENNTTVALYTGNTILNQGRKGVCTIRRYDALTGKQIWAFQVPDVVYSNAAEVGCYASPVVGQNAVSDLVFFTVTNGETGATLYALTKATGEVRWSKALETPSVSSPVAVYNLAGDAWLLQAESDGKLFLLEAKTGKTLNTMQLEGSVEASPAVYRDVLVITTTGVDTSYIYGIKLE